MLLEDTSQWAGEVQAALTDVGVLLARQGEGFGDATGTGAGTGVCPVPALLDDLQELCGLLSAVSATHALRAWPASSLLRVAGVTLTEVMDAYLDLNRRWLGRRADRLLRVLWDASGALESWLATLRNDSTE